MRILRDRIKEESKIIEGEIIRVDSFLNHQVDIKLLEEIGKEFKKRFADIEVNKIVTAEVSGIAIATIVAQEFNVPMVFARKTESLNVSEDKYTADVYSYTGGNTYKMMISKEYIGENDKVLIVDDFLANGKAITGLIELIDKSGAQLSGVGVVVEKGFQVGGKALRDEGIRFESLVAIDSIEDGEIEFR